MYGIGEKLEKKIKKIVGDVPLDMAVENPKVYDLLPEATKAYLKYKPIQGVPRAALKKLVSKFEKADCIVAGSYRRGKEKCNDLDILSPVGNKKFLNLIEKPFAAGDEIIRTFCQISPGVYIFCDIFMYTDLAPYLLYATGSKNFNKYMRGVAKSKGYILNQHHLAHKESGEIIPADSEKKIFEILDIKYLEPHERNF